MLRGAPSRRFNPRAHEGRDPLSVWFFTRESFNPRAHEGRDGVPSFTSHGSGSFNPRAHEGRDWGWWSYGCNVQSFNPRAHEGRDGVGGRIAATTEVSTHAPTRGATPALLISSMISLFQPTRPRGARPSLPRCLPPSARFNPRAHEGRDSCNYNPINIDLIQAHFANGQK